MNMLGELKNKIIISIQAMPNEPLYNETCIMAVAESVIKLAGINAVRLAGERDIKNIKCRPQ